MFSFSSRIFAIPNANVACFCPSWASRSCADAAPQAVTRSNRITRHDGQAVQKTTIDSCVKSSFIAIVLQLPSLGPSGTGGPGPVPTH